MEWCRERPARTGDGVAAVGSARAPPASVDRSELAQVGGRRRTALDLVDVDDLKLLTPPAGAEAQFAHATKTVDANTNRPADFSGGVS